ncbi:MAG TPA: amino acid adenylation domain-containing protein [Kofleriaceae bacterium]|nr:amino acid adenylation domain-containing protein [Kofleriaceae bacterium]
MSQTIAADLRQLLADLARRGVRLSTRGDVLQCDAPHGSLNASTRALLSSRKGEIIAFLDQQAAPPVAGSALRGIAPAPPGTPVPLSFAQRRLWVQTQLDDTSTAYNMRIALALHGALDVAALEAAVAALVRRHAVLRTRFVTRDGQPVQIVAEAAELAVTRLDLQGLTAAERAAELERIMERAARTPFDLARAPLLRIGLVAMAPGEHVLLVTLHHLVGDGVSLAILAGEIRELYAAAREARPPRLPELPVQYTEFATWQHQTLDDERLAGLRRHWVDTLTGAPPLLELPTDRPRTASADPRGETFGFQLSAELAGELRALARASGTTLFMTLLAGFAAVLARYSNQSDLVIGCPFSLRSHDELEPLIGMFVNSLAMRIRLGDNPTFHDLLAHVRDVASDAYAHGELPLDQLVEALHPERSPSHHPIYQVMFIHDNAPATLPELGGVRFDLLAHSEFDAKFDLMLSMNEVPDGIRGVWEYRAALFDRATIRRATEHLAVVLRAMVTDPGGRVMQAPLMTADERHQALEVWSHNGRAPAIERTILELIDHQIAAAPRAPAVRVADTVYSYAELDRRAHQLARHLRQLGVRSGDRVAVLLPRSAELLAGLLAVLRAGAAYIPLDPSYPGARIADALDDAGPAALITTAALAAGLPGAIPVVRVDADAGAIARAAGELPPSRRALDEPAYLMYTSGSTGRPKAAIITHGGLAGYLTWSAAAYGMTSGTRAAVSTSIAFDATITTLWSPLVAGATVVLLPEGGEIEALAELLQRDDGVDGVDVVKLTPSHIDGLRAHTGDAPRPGGARVFVVGGEQLLAEHVAWCQKVAPRARVINEYGPTETVVGCCIHEVAPGEAVPDIVPIGRPIDRTELYVLNPWLEPVPVGVPGELYIGGAGVALGYHLRPELTAEKFVAHPFARPGTRLYRTGDRVVWSADGSLRFLGRVDHQVKVRGFRIELGEIDAQLARHPAVREAVTVVRDAGHGRPQLVSYVVAAHPELTAEALRHDLLAQLPEHMIPAAVVFLPQLPLTPNGKVDRAALPSPAAARSGGEPPTTDLERELAAVWSEVLRKSPIGRDDNFFELGGDSILGIQLVARARERGIELVPRQLFQNQTLAQLAAVARRDERTAVAQGPVTGPFALAPIQRRFFAEHPVAPHHFNQSVLLEVPADVDAAALGRALGQLAGHHDLLRARFTQGDAGASGDIAPPGPVGSVELAIADLSELPAAERGARLAAVIAGDQAALDLARGPLFAPRLFRMGAQPGRLLLTAHHLVVDAVSWRILLEDLLRAYEAERAGTGAALPARTAAYGTWVEQLTAWAGSADAAAELARWTAVPDRPIAALRPDHALDAGANRAGDTAELTRSLAAADTAQLRDASRAAYNVNLQEVLLAALALALSGERGTATVDVEGHGRDGFDGIDVSRTVGWFTSMFPVHLPLSADRDPAATLTAVKELLRAIPHGGLGHGALRTLSPDPAVRAALDGLPAAQLRFNYFGQLDGGEPPAPGFALAAEPCEPQRSPLGDRRHLVDLNAWISGGQLAMAWTYSRRLFDAATIEALADRVIAGLADLARICAGAGAPHYTPSDFPDISLSQDHLDLLLADIAGANEKD